MRTDYDPEAIARACLGAQLEHLTDMDGSAIADAAAADDLNVPDDDDHEAWDLIGSAIGQLADRVREHAGIDQPEVAD